MEKKHFVINHTQKGRWITEEQLQTGDYEGTHNCFVCAQQKGACKE